MDPPAAGFTSDGVQQFTRRSIVTLALTVLTCSQGILIAMSKNSGNTYDYAPTTVNCMVEVVKCCISLVSLVGLWRSEGKTADNTLATTWEEVKVYPIPAALYLVKNLMQYWIFVYVDAPSYQVCPANANPPAHPAALRELQVHYCAMCL